MNDKMSLDFLLKSVDGKLLTAHSTGSFTGISTDSRKIREGELYFALRGEKYDGHDFVKEAFYKGAAGAVIDNVSDNITDDLPVDKIVVLTKSSLESLGALASAWRKSMAGVKLAAITGSNGKTTTKEMTYGILSLNNTTLKNEGNFNNEVGLPYTLLKLTPLHTSAVVEMGMNDYGEIKRLTKIAAPDIGAITNIGKGHLEKLGSLEGVAKAKGELVEDFDDKNTFIVNADDPHINIMAEKLNCNKITVGLSDKTLDITATDIEHMGLAGMKFDLRVMGKKAPVSLGVIGIQNVANSLIASGIATAMGCGIEEIRSGLERYKPVHMRLEVMDTPYGFTIINDSYNANPDSMRKALDVLGSLSNGGSKIAVLGDMLELGESSEDEHRTLGQYAVESGVDLLLVYGDFARTVIEGAGGKIEGKLIADHNEAASILRSFAKPGDCVLIKGSRGMKMESVIENLFVGLR